MKLVMTNTLVIWSLAVPYKVNKRYFPDVIIADGLFFKIEQRWWCLILIFFKFCLIYLPFSYCFGFILFLHCWGSNSGPIAFFFLNPFETSPQYYMLSTHETSLSLGFLLSQLPRLVIRSDRKGNQTWLFFSNLF